MGNKRKKRRGRKRSGRKRHGGEGNCSRNGGHDERSVFQGITHTSAERETKR